MIDFEDISISIFAYLREKKDRSEWGLPGSGLITRLNASIEDKNTEKGDTMLESIPDQDNRYILEQRIKEIQILNRWIDLSMEEVVTLNSNFDTASKLYAIALSSLIKDDLTNNTFYRSVRMAEVLKNIMVEFFKCNRNQGFAYGEITSLSMPERVNVKGDKVIKSGVTYLITII